MIGAIKGDTRSLDYSSHPTPLRWFALAVIGSLGSPGDTMTGDSGSICRVKLGYIR